MRVVPEGAQRGVSLAPLVTLRAGGPAEWLIKVHSADEFAEVTRWVLRNDDKLTVLGWGSNVLPSDDGVPGWVIWNQAEQIEFLGGGEIVAETGCGFQSLFLACAKRGVGGLEFAVGIPGSLGGALVSNAGAYRSDVKEFLTSLEVVDGGTRKWVEPEWLGLTYRDSLLRREPGGRRVIIRAKMKLPLRDPKKIYDEAREYQRQRISKQPPPASAGSFFKNVIHPELASTMEGLTPGMRANGVIPAGFLLEAVGLRGYRHRGAMFAERHANFIVNTHRATATEIRELAEIGKQLVQNRFGVELEEEVLYLGDWSRFERRRKG